MTDTDEEVLEFDPFQGDFGMPDDIVFTNKMAIARKPGPCSHCNAVIAKGERIRRMASKYDGELMTHRWCAECCTAMATYRADLENEDLDMPVYETRSGLYKERTDQ